MTSRSAFPDNLQQYFLDQVGAILREPAGYLAHPFLVPGGGYADQLWDWDSFWVAKGLLNIECDDDQRARFLKHALGSWRNFFDNQAENGTVPILAMANNRDVFNCASSPSQNQAKPVLGQFALEIVKASGEHEWLRPYFPKLLRFYQRWTEHYMSRCGLLVWGSDVAVGVDNDPTTYCRPEFSSGSLLLNCLYYEDLSASAELAFLLDEPAVAADLRAKAESIRRAIQTECWDENDGFYYTVDVQCEDLRDKYLSGIPKGMDTSWQTLPLKVKVFTGFLPMWCGIATEEHARTMVERHLRNAGEFDCLFGVRTLAATEKMYNTNTNTSNPSNWLGPVWILSNYLVYIALKRYGYDQDARELADKTLKLLQSDIESSGCLHECYHPETGEPNFNHGFFSWNILVSQMV